MVREEGQLGLRKKVEFLARVERRPVFLLRLDRVGVTSVGIFDLKEYYVMAALFVKGTYQVSVALTEELPESGGRLFRRQVQENHFAERILLLRRLFFQGTQQGPAHRPEDHSLRRLLRPLLRRPAQPELLQFFAPT